MFAFFLAFVCMPFSADPLLPDQVLFFEQKIRPVLVESCQKCHSAEAAKLGKLKGGLRLDSRKGVLAGGDSGHAIIAGNPDASLLIKSLRHTEDLKMPPKGKIPQAIITDFEKWVRMGAPDPRELPIETSKPPRVIDFAEGKKFWSLAPLLKIVPPQVKPGVLVPGWPRTAVDHFILAKLRSVGIDPNPIADVRILVRRAWFDLLGLPPSPEEMVTWSKRLVKDSQIDPAAWESLLDHLLAQPQYGERWARHWMDIARFAESHGYEQDYNRLTAYPYRDFLIQAFNSDMPFDQFVRWQIAGDELAPKDPLAWMATGFLGAGAFPTQLTETEFESARYDELDDMVSTIGVAFMGLSLGCARCHDHKFDPISAKDYYRFAASFATVIRTEKDLDLDPVANAAKSLRHAKRIRELETDLARYEKDLLPAELDQYLKKANFNAPWIPLDGTIHSSANTKFIRQADGSLLATGTAPIKETLVFTSVIKTSNIRAIRLEALADPSLPKGGPGRAGNGNFVLGDFKVTAGADGSSSIPEKMVFFRGEATYQQNTDSLSVAASLDSDPVTGWAVDGQIGKSQAVAFYLAKPINSDGKLLQLTITVICNHPNAQHVMGRIRFSITTEERLKPSIGDSGPDAQTLIALNMLRKRQGKSEDQVVAMRWFRQTQPEWLAKWNSLQLEKNSGAKPTLTRALVVSEGLPHLSHHADDRGFPHFYPHVHLLRRGDANQKVELVSQGFPDVFAKNDIGMDHWRLEKPADAKSSYRRAALANWMTNTQKGAGHLVARVVANRLWQHHFGKGIVVTPNDFGYAGGRPSHPELLDWLAGELITGGWKLKSIHKLLMTSSVYMQSVASDEARSSIDRENTLWWRRVPRRLEAEAIRDSLLACSSTLDKTQFGPGTLDPSMRRRSIYFLIKRSGLIPMMMLFDWPEHLVSIGQRSSTTVAPQALAFLNGPQVREYAEAITKKLSKDYSEAIRQAFQHILCREPSIPEIAVATDFVIKQEKQRIERKMPPNEAKQLALTDLCQSLFSMNEFIFIE